METTQSGTLDITDWLLRVLECMDRALHVTDDTLGKVFSKTRFWEKHSAFEFNHRQRMLLNKLPDGFDGKLTSSKWAAIAKCSPDTVLWDIQDLMEKSIFKKESAGGSDLLLKKRAIVN